MSLQYQYKIMQKGNESVQNYQLESVLFLFKTKFSELTLLKMHGKQKGELLCRSKEWKDYVWFIILYIIPRPSHW